MDAILSFLLNAAGLYTLLGLGVALMFYIRWLEIMDPTAKGGSRGFKTITAPGVIALWPLILVKVLRRKTATSPNAAYALRRNHRVAIQVLIVCGWFVITAALVWRIDDSTELPRIHIPLP